MTIYLYETTKGAADMKKILGIVFFLLMAALLFWQYNRAADTQDTQEGRKADSASTLTPAMALVPNTIHFTVTKAGTMLYLDGTFANRAQARRFAKNLRPTYATRKLQNNISLSDKGGIALASRILPLFKKRYAKGTIEYRDGILTVEGTVRSQKISSQMNTMLQSSTLGTKNLTQIDPSVRLPMSARSHKRRIKRKAKRRAKRKKRTASKKRVTSKKVKVPVRQKRPKKVATKKTKVPAKQKRPKKVLVKKAVPKKIPAKKAPRTALTKTRTPTTAHKTNKQSEKEARRGIRALLRSHKIEFLAAKGALTPKGQASVDRLASILKKYSRVHIEIAGYTDSDGSESFNQRLSQKRVDTVKKRLIAKGINPRRLRAKGYGESRPLVPNTSEANKQKNRRVEINVLRKL